MESKPSKSVPPCPFPRLHQSELRRDDTYFMSLAFNEAIKAWEAGEVPIGAVISREGTVVARAHNRVESGCEATMHAEVLAISSACAAVGDWRLGGHTLYVTKEPCPMCSGAALLARFDAVVYAVGDPKMGCLGGATDLNELPRMNHRLEIRTGVLEEECRAILQAFFQLRRERSQRPETTGGDSHNHTESSGNKPSAG